MTKVKIVTVKMVVAEHVEGTDVHDHICNAIHQTDLTKGSITWLANNIQDIAVTMETVVDDDPEGSILD